MLHLRLALPLILAVGAAAHCGAQVMVAPPLQPEDEKPPAEKAEEKPEPWQLHPASEPDPALRYRFWPAREDQVASNPVPFVNRAIIMLQSRESSEFWQQYQEWAEVARMPLEALPIAEIKEALAAQERPLNELQRAENLMDLEYDLRMQELTVSETVATLLPEIQEMRSLARLLHLRGRVAIAEGRWEDLTRDVRVGFRLAEVAGHSTDFLVGRLVGIAISGVMMDLVEEAIQQPGCPNFYWALATVPDRLYETRGSMQFESTLMRRIFQDVPEFSDEPIGEAAARAHLQRMAGEIGQWSMLAPFPSDPTTAKLALGASVVMLAEPARDYLAATPRWGARARDLSASEAVLRAGLLKTDRLLDNWVKWALLPPELFTQYRDEFEKAINPDAFPPDPITLLSQLLFPAVQAAHRAERRSLQLRNLLITVEALRMHAAGAGELPKSLDSLQPVPAWPDSLAYGSFGYERISPTRATLTGEPRYSGDEERTINIHLELDPDVAPGRAQVPQESAIRIPVRN